MYNELQTMFHLLGLLYQDLTRPYISLKAEVGVWACFRD